MRDLVTVIDVVSELRSAHEGHPSRQGDIAASSHYRGVVGCVYKKRVMPGRPTSCLCALNNDHCHRYLPLQVVCSVVIFKCTYQYIMMSSKWLVCAFVVASVSVRQATTAPAGQQEEYPPMPYEYKYDVEDQEKDLYFGANESGDIQGKVIGGYHVLLPDGRLMTVEYTVEGDSGFVPKITFENNANPFGKGK